MISRLDAPQTLLIRRCNANGTTCYPRIKDAVEEAINDADHQSEALFALSNSSKILFSERIVICEGKTERTILPAVFGYEFEMTPGENKIGIVDIGGTPNIPNSLKVLDTMGVPCKAIVDLDFAFRLAPIKGLLEPTDEDLVSCKEVLVKLSDAGDIRLDAAGLPTNYNGVTAAAAFEKLAEDDTAKPHIANLHEHLKQKGIWIWTRGAIEAHLGISKTSVAQKNLIDNIENDEFRNAMPDYQSVKEALMWLRQ